MLAIIVNDNAECLVSRGAWTSIASKLAPTGDVCRTAMLRLAQTTVGASLLAIIVNDNEGCLVSRGAWASIASKLAPTGFVSTGMLLLAQNTVGASLLAMIANDDTGCLAPTYRMCVAPQCCGLHKTL